MNLLASSPFGACFARPWVDGVGLSSARRGYLPLSRLWAAANLPGGRNRDSFERAEAAQRTWETAIFAGEGDDLRNGVLDAERRRAASWHMATRGRFLAEPLLRSVPIARWDVSAPDETERVLAAGGDRLAWPGEVAVQQSASFVRKGLREYWLRAPTPSPLLAARPAARVSMPASSSRPTVQRARP